MGNPNNSTTIIVTSMDSSLDFEFQLLNSTSVMLSNYEGNPIVLDFFATWAQPCITQEAELAKVHDHYPNITIISISIDLSDSIAALSDFQNNNNMTWVVGRDFKEEATNYFSITSIPTLAYIGYSGSVLHHNSGVQSYTTISTWITSDPEPISSTSVSSTNVLTISDTSLTTTTLPHITSGLEFLISVLWLVGIGLYHSKRTRI